MDTAALIALAGLDVNRFMDTKDTMERNLMIKIAERVRQQREIMDRNLATRIVNGVGRLFGG